MVVSLNVLNICILLKVLVKIDKNTRIIDLQKPLRRVCNGIVIQQFKEDYIHRAFGTSIL